MEKLQFNIINVDGQINLVDCGLCAIAYATHLAHGKDPIDFLWNHESMRSHLIQCFEDNEMACFPTKGHPITTL